MARPSQANSRCQANYSWPGPSPVGLGPQLAPNTSPSPPASSSSSGPSPFAVRPGLPSPCPGLGPGFLGRPGLLDGKVHYFPSLVFDNVEELLAAPGMGLELAQYLSLFLILAPEVGADGINLASEGGGKAISSPILSAGSSECSSYPSLSPRMLMLAVRLSTFLAKRLLWASCSSALRSGLAMVARVLWRALARTGWLAASAVFFLATLVGRAAGVGDASRDAVVDSDS